MVRLRVSSSSHTDGLHDDSRPSDSSMSDKKQYLRLTVSSLPAREQRWTSSCFSRGEAGRGGAGPERSARRRLSTPARDPPPAWGFWIKPYSVTSWCHAFSADRTLRSESLCLPAHSAGNRHQGRPANPKARHLGKGRRAGKSKPGRPGAAADAAGRRRRRGRAEDRGGSVAALPRRRRGGAGLWAEAPPPSRGSPSPSADDPGATHSRTTWPAPHGTRARRCPQRPRHGKRGRLRRGIRPPPPGGGRCPLRRAQDAPPRLRTATGRRPNRPHTVWTPMGDPTLLVCARLCACVCAWVCVCARARVCACVCECV